MEHLPKETLLMIIKDLTEKLEEKKKSSKNTDVISKLLKSEDELKAGLAVAERDKASLIIENEELGKEIDRLKSEKAQSETSVDETSSESSTGSEAVADVVDEFSMNSRERINTFHFIEKFCKWTEEPQRVLDKDDNIYRTVAIGSVQEIHKGLREWAKQSGIATKGKERGIPVYDSFKKFIVNEHKKKYSNIPWRISETNKFPKFYNGSYSTPRVNLKVSGRVTRFL
jgi:hypothetical protein